MGAQHSSLDCSIKEIREGIANGPAAELWRSNCNRSKKYIELTVGGRKWRDEELLLAAKLAERLVGCTIVEAEASTAAHADQTKADICKVAVALLSYYNGGNWGLGVVLSSWAHGCSNFCDIVDGTPGKRRDEDKIRRQREAMRMEFPNGGSKAAVLRQLLCGAVNDIKTLIKESPCLVHTPSLCNGTCADAAAYGATAREWVCSAIDRAGVFQQQQQQQPAGGGAPGTSAAAGTSRAGSCDDSSAEGEQAGVGVSRSAAISDPESADAGHSDATITRTGNTSSHQPQQQQQQKKGQQQPPKTVLTRSAAPAQLQQISAEHARAAAAAAAAAAEKRRAAAAAASKLTPLELLDLASRECENMIVRTMAQVLVKGADKRAKAEECCKQHIQKVFAGLPYSSKWQNEMETKLTEMKELIDSLFEITPPTGLRSMNEQLEYVRVLRAFTRGDFTAGPSWYGDVIEELGKGAYGRVVRRENLKTGKIEALKQIVISTYPKADGKKKKKQTVNKPLVGDLAELAVMDAREAAKEYILSQLAGSAAEAHVAKPHGCWIEKVTSGCMRAVTLQLPMAEGVDLYKLKLAYVGEEVHQNEFLALHPILQQLAMEAYALIMGRGLVASLDHAHSLKIYHSDIKISNAMVLKEGVLQLESLPLKSKLQFIADPPVDVVLIDWGMASAARPIGSEEKFSAIDNKKGTRYVRPFELANKKELEDVAPGLVDKLDIWAAGIAIAEAVWFEYDFEMPEDTGNSGSQNLKGKAKKPRDIMDERCCFEFTDMNRTTEKAILGRVQEVQDKLRQCGASQALQSLVRSCLAKTPADRPTAHELYVKCDSALKEVLPRLYEANLLDAPLIEVEPEEQNAKANISL